MKTMFNLSQINVQHIDIMNYLTKGRIISSILTSGDGGVLACILLAQYLALPSPHTTKAGRANFSGGSNII
jgi:hypothetical protein